VDEFFSVDDDREGGCGGRGKDNEERDEEAVTVNQRPVTLAVTVTSLPI